MRARVTHASIVTLSIEEIMCIRGASSQMLAARTNLSVAVAVYALAGRAATVLEGDPFLGHVREPTQRIEIFAFVTLRVSETAVMK
jgi:hypothetical protein